MHVWRIAVVNKILNFRKYVTVSADTYVHAIHAAEHEYGKYGYDKVESCMLADQLSSN